MTSSHHHRANFWGYVPFHTEVGWSTTATLSNSDIEVGQSNWPKCLLKNGDKLNLKWIATSTQYRFVWNTHKIKDFMAIKSTIACKNIFMSFAYEVACSKIAFIGKPTGRPSSRQANRMATLLINDFTKMVLNKFLFIKVLFD